jgi:hypothetical protein
VHIGVFRAPARVNFGRLLLANLLAALLLAGVFLAPARVNSEIHTPSLAASRARAEMRKD